MECLPNGDDDETTLDDLRPVKPSSPSSSASAAASSDDVNGSAEIPAAVTGGGDPVAVGDGGQKIHLMRPTTGQGVVVCRFRKSPTRTSTNSFTNRSTNIALSA